MHSGRRNRATSASQAHHRQHRLQPVDLVPGLHVDGALPNAACADIAIPTTGGWSSTDSNWRYLKLAAPLNLSAGKHRLRMVNLADGLGVDFFVLRAMP